jgi:hypothetical protein
MTLHVKRLPDFVVIGAMKCGTSTLHEQLAAQPGVFMSTPKEPNFFSDDDGYSRGLEWYCSLFESAPREALCGESSTHYTKLPTHPATISRMKLHLKTTKFIYIMRHPIDRLMSQYAHEWTKRRVSGPISEAIQTNPELVAYSQYAMQLEPYLEYFGPDRVLPVMFDALITRSQETLNQVCQFIGLGGTPQWDDAKAHENASSQRLRTSPVRDWLADAPLLRSIRHRMIPPSMNERIKRLWKLNEQPRLLPEEGMQLKDIFDRDLERLGLWLGLPISCDNFKDTGRTATPTWQRL